MIGHFCMAISKLDRCLAECTACIVVPFRQCNKVCCSSQVYQPALKMIKMCTTWPDAYIKLCILLMFAHCICCLMSYLGCASIIMMLYLINRNRAKKKKLVRNRQQRCLSASNEFI